MFRSLQHSPSVITLFHNPQSQASVKILHILEKNQANNTHKNGEYKFVLDKTTLPPTPDQFNFFKQSLHMNPVCKRALKLAYPNLTKDINLVVDLQNLNNTDNGQFVAPLVVDWDHKLLAVTEKGLTKILDQFNARED